MSLVCRILVTACALAVLIHGASAEPVANDFATSRVLMVCHRGANHVAPENTMAAARKALELGADYIEVDVRTSSDGVMYNIHDSTVDRTTNGSGKVRELTSAEIDGLDAGSWFGPEFAGERVPRIREMLEWARGKTGIYFDAKDAEIPELIRMTYETGMQDDVFWWFGDADDAVAFRKLDQQMALKINLQSPGDMLYAARVKDVQIVEIRAGQLNEHTRRMCHDRGRAIMVLYLGDDVDEMRRIYEWRPEMINLDRGDLLNRVRE